MRLILSLFILLFSLPAYAETQKESAFDRIMRTGVIRCGYYVFPPVTYRDPNTNKLSGFTVDMMDEIAKRAGLKIEWTEETNFANWIPAIQGGRFDVACTPIWPDIPLGRVVAFTTPMYYAGLYPMVRADDERFKSNDFELLNNENITFATPDGDSQASLIRSHFPKAKINSMADGTNISAFAMEVVTKKADAFLTERNGMVEFNKNNPVKLRLMGEGKPVKLQSSNLAVESSEVRLKNFLDNAIADLLNDGTIDRLLKKWEPEPGKTYLRVAPPFEGSH